MWGGPGRPSWPASDGLVFTQCHQTPCLHNVTKHLVYTMSPNMHLVYTMSPNILFTHCHQTSCLHNVTKHLVYAWWRAKYGYWHAWNFQLDHQFGLSKYKLRHWCHIHTHTHTAPPELLDVQLCTADQNICYYGALHPKVTDPQFNVTVKYAGYGEFNVTWSRNGKPVNCLPHCSQGKSNNEAVSVWVTGTSSNSQYWL